MQWPFVSRALYLNVLRQLVAERRRADGACAALEAERKECNRMVRHLTSQFLRKQNAYGLPDEKPTEPTPSMQVVHGPRYDAGELAAVIAEADRLGFTKESAIALFRKEKGLDDTDLIM